MEQGSAEELVMEVEAGDVKPVIENSDWEQQLLQMAEAGVREFIAEDGTCYVIQVETNKMSVNEDENEVENECSVTHSEPEDQELVTPWVQKGRSSLGAIRQDSADKLFLNLCLRSDYKSRVLIKQKRKEKIKVEAFSQICLEMRIAGFNVTVRRMLQHFRNLQFRYFRFYRTMTDESKRPPNFDLMHELFSHVPDPNPTYHLTHPPKKRPVVSKRKGNKVRPASSRPSHVEKSALASALKSGSEFFTKVSSSSAGEKEFEAHDIEEENASADDSETLLEMKFFQDMVDDSILVLKELKQQNQDSKKYHEEVLSLAKESLNSSKLEQTRQIELQNKEMAIQEKKLLLLENLFQKIENL